jgi:hypothetical protein
MPLPDTAAAPEPAADVHRSPTTLKAAAPAVDAPVGDDADVNGLDVPAAVPHRRDGSPEKLTTDVDCVLYRVPANRGDPMNVDDARRGRQQWQHRQQQQQRENGWR